MAEPLVATDAVDLAIATLPQRQPPGVAVSDLRQLAPTTTPSRKSRETVVNLAGQRIRGGEIRVRDDRIGGRDQG
jgi:hypothetical protein